MDELWSTIKSLMERHGDNGEKATQEAAELAAKHKLCSDVYMMGLSRDI